jgi:hypothetical protein
MDTEIIKRLKGWFYLRLTPEDWTIFGESAESVLRTFDHDRDPKTALLRFAWAVIMLEAQRLNSPGMIVRRSRELVKLGVDPRDMLRTSAPESTN